MNADEPTLATVSIPIENGDLEAIEQMLEHADVFTTSFQNRGRAVFQASTYLNEAVVRGTHCHVLIDRNLISPLVKLVAGDRVPGEQRLAAAVLAFAQTIDASIEPNMALYELAQSSTVDAPADELTAFRLLDNTHPQVLANVAVGKARALDVTQLPYSRPAPVAVDFSVKLRVWRFCYIHALKLATLHDAPGGAVGRMSELMRWMDEDFLWSAPALLFAASFLAAKPRGGLMHGINSTDPEVVLHGIRNAAWDLALVYEWNARLQTQARENKLWILATADKRLRAIARDLIAPSWGKDPGVCRELMFTEAWGAEGGQRLTREHDARDHRRGSSDRRANHPSAEEGGRIQEELESRLAESCARRVRPPKVDPTPPAPDTPPGPATAPAPTMAQR